MDQSRWVRPLDVEPGHWKKQLPTKSLKLALSRDDSNLRELIEREPQIINKQGPHGRTFLFEAIRRGKKDLVEWLLQQGANPNLTGCYNSETLVQLSALAAARYYKRQDLEQVVTAAGGEWDIWRAAFCDEQDAVDLFLLQDSTLVHAEDPNDEIYFYPPMSFAVAGGNLKLAQKLLALGADLQRYGLQFCFIGAHLGRIDLVHWLIQNGARLEQANSSFWVSTNDLGIMKTLVNAGLSANAPKYSDLTPLHYVCRGDKGEQTAKLSLLIELGAEINAIGAKGRTALHYASVAGYAESISLLLSAGADRNIRDYDGYRPIDLATGRNALLAKEALSV